MKVTRLGSCRLFDANHGSEQFHICNICNKSVVILRIFEPSWLRPQGTKTDGFSTWIVRVAGLAK